MNIFYFKKQSLILIFLVSVVLIGLQFLNTEEDQDPLTSLSFQVFSEIQTASVNFHKSLSSLIEKYLFLLELRENNEFLKKENNRLKIRQQLFEETLEENKRLKKTIDFSANQKFQLLASEIISTDFLSKSQLFVINKGRSHGVKQFMGVLHPSGVVGYIFRTSPNSSQVITLINPLSSLPVRNRRSRVTGLVSLSKEDRLIF